MGTQQRRDLLMNVPALQKLDAMLLVGMAVKILQSSFLGAHYAFEQMSEIQFVWCYLL
jgi:hypothetical protein